MLSLTKNALEELDNPHDFERMCADILLGSGYDDVVPIAPRGGADEGKDITFRFDTDKRGLACVTLRKDIAAKFKEDFYQRKPGEFAKYYLFCTSHVSPKQRAGFERYCLESLQADLVVQDIEALRGLLDVRFSDIKSRYLHLPLPSTDKAYDTNTEASFSSWLGYVNAGDPNAALGYGLRNTDNKPFLMMRTFEDESVGFNKAMAGWEGRIEFDYQIVSSEPREMNVAFYVIPMGKRFTDDYELSQGEQFSSRQVYLPPPQYVGDNRWHRWTFPFNFRGLPELIFTIFAPRINEGRADKGPAQVHLSNIQIFT
jgi:hypothetical protein